MKSTSLFRPISSIVQDFPILFLILAFCTFILLAHFKHSLIPPSFFFIFFLHRLFPTNLNSFVFIFSSFIPYYLPLFTYILLFHYVLRFIFLKLSSLTIIISYFLQFPTQNLVHSLFPSIILFLLFLPAVYLPLSDSG